MRRLLRILLNAATVLSLVLCAATMAAWVRSYHASDYVWWSVGKPRLLLHFVTHRGGSFVGVIRVLGSESDRIPSPRAGWEQYTPGSYAEAGASQRTFFNRQGFRFDYFGDEKNPILQLACPYWFIMLLTAILPGARLAGWRRRARRLRMRPGLCQHCGYDCRATPDRCPECGRVSGGP